jgi:hypothetical protein
VPEGARWYRETAVPEVIKRRRKSLDDRPDREDIVVGELGARIHLKIMITDVAPADQGDRIIRNQQLIVHPIIEPRGIEQEFQAAQQLAVAAIHERIEDPNFDIRLPVEGKNLSVAGDRFTVVHEYTHTNAASRGAA